MRSGGALEETEEAVWEVGEQQGNRKPFSTLAQMTVSWVKLQMLKKQNKN